MTAGAAASLVGNLDVKSRKPPDCETNNISRKGVTASTTYADGATNV